MHNLFVIKKIDEFLSKSQQDGLFLATLLFFRKLINKIYCLLVFHRFNISLDFTSKIIGVHNIKIGKNFSAGKHLWIEAVNKYHNQAFKPQIVIKDDISFSDFNHIGAVNYIEIGNRVLFGSNCYVTDHNHGNYSQGFLNQSDPLVSPIERQLNCKQRVIIGDNVWIGNNVTILPGVNIGEGTVIGANAVVVKDIPPYCIAVGIPAKVIKRWDFTINQWKSI